MPTADDVAADLDEMWRALEHRVEMREATRGGYNAGWRCWDCRRFVSGPSVTCSHCGYRHGGQNHEAYATR